MQLMKLSGIDIDRFTQAYIECALWSSSDYDADGDEVSLDDYDASDIDESTLKRIIEDCAAFQLDNAELLAELNFEQSGHDFWLTRNRHGAGFWDRGLGDIGRQLTDAAHAWGSFDLYVTDDGEIAGS